jgi:hypothetical protein
MLRLLCEVTETHRIRDFTKAHSQPGVHSTYFKLWGGYEGVKAGGVERKY